MQNQKPAVQNSTLRAVHDGVDIRVPFFEISGNKRGPVLTVVAGTHGAEYAGIEAAIRLAKQITPDQLTGTLRIVPICNIPGFLGRSEVECPVDGKNLNRLFPGNVNGTYTEHLAHLVYENVVRGSDCLLNLHGGDIFEELSPFTAIGITGISEVDDKTRELAGIYDLPFIVAIDHLPGAVVGQYSLNEAAQKDGIPAILTEAGGRGLVEEEFVQLHLNGILNTLKWMDMIEGKISLVNPANEMQGEYWKISEEGVFYPEVSVGEKVKIGQRLGVVNDWFGNTLEIIVAKRDAYILAVVITPAARKNAIAFAVAC